MSHRPLLALGSLLILTAACSDRSTDPAGMAPRSEPLANVNLKGGAHAVPTYADLVLLLQGSGALSGLGNADLFVGMKATANVTATCTNPAGATQPPGQNPAPITISGGQAIPADAIKNGNVPFSVTTGAPVTPIPGAPGCPNTQWTEAIVDLAFTTATITVQQPQDSDHPDANIVLRLNCTFSPATDNEQPVPGAKVACTK
jgi:hypothetical protein